LPTTEITGRHHTLITDVLTLFVLIELSRSLVDYFKVQRLRMTFIVDAAIVFVIREVMIGLFQEDASTAKLYAMCALLAVFTVLRIGSILVYQRELQMVDSVKR
ncbi:MAG: phosphate-starvation-inducible PsiE family protein, partial [bacterium]